MNQHKNTTRIGRRLTASPVVTFHRPAGAGFLLEGGGMKDAVKFRTNGKEFGTFRAARIAQGIAAGKESCRYLIFIEQYENGKWSPVCSIRGKK